MAEDTAAAGANPSLIDTPRLEVPLEVVEGRQGSRLAGLFSMVISLAMLVVVAYQFSGLSFAEVGGMIPTNPLFWLVFAGYYLAGPVSEWIIYRRLWAMPLAGLGALLRKLVSNEILLGYLGEAQFYGWARARLKFVTAPFGAIKDVTILSALIGNFATLAMLVWAWPLVSSGELGLEGRTVFISLGVVLITSFLILLLRQKLFSLPKNDLWFISVVHLVRIAAVVIFSAWMWHLVLPQVEISLWIVMATLRMLVSRLPLLPNKDVVFAGIAVFLLGHDVEIAGLMTLMAVLLLVTHLVVGAVFAALDLFDAEKVK
ncbi:MAG: hypothetical protein J0M19_06570 [Sphingomonadales bacterium]|nr:hypothetical protein [Sphingomonadales bacterium]